MGLSWAGADAQGLTLYVAPTGDDSWSGRLEQVNGGRSDGPLASLAGARDAVRRARSAGPLNEAVKIVVAEGRYALSEAVRFEPQDSGSAQFPVNFEAAPGAQPVFSGGQKIEGWTSGGDGLWQAKLPKVAGEKWIFEQLWVNGRRATRARTPNEGYFQALRAADVPLAGVAMAGPLEKTALVANPGDAALLQGLSPEALHAVNVIVYHSWQTSRHRVAGLDVASGHLQFTGPARWAFFQSEPYHRMHFENFREALDAPGEWFLDPSGTLLYKPRPGEEMATAEVIGPVSERWLTFAGDAEKGQSVSHLRFAGLHFAHSQYLLPAQGWTDSQADAVLGACIEANGVEEIVFEDCEFAHSGLHALWFRHGCRQAVVRQSHFHDLGAGGIKVGETVAPAQEAGQTRDIRIENNIIQGGGRYFPGSIGVWIGHSGHNQIIHNDIADFFYSAISVGWVWGFKPSLAVENRIEWNHLHHLGWGMLSDMGAVYTLGPSAGTTIRFNRVHDISCASYGGWGLYNDEGSSGILLENNLVYRTQSGGYHQHYGRENRVRNNIFAFGKEMQLRHSRSEEHLAFSFEQNIVLWDEGKLLGHLDAGWRGRQVKLGQNLYWCRQQGAVDFASKSFAQWVAGGQDLHSLIADPLFVDPDHGDFQLRSGSPAAAIGFVPFEYEKAGVTGSTEWRARAVAIRYPAMIFGEKMRPPGLTLREGFEPSAIGKKPRIARVQEGGQEGAITVVATEPHSGEKCLQIIDGPEVKPSYNPHLYYMPHHRGGRTQIRFALKVDAAAAMGHEWRSAMNAPYQVSLSWRIEKGGLFVGSQKLMGIPAGQWVEMEMEAGIGDQSDGLWSLVVTVPGQPAEKFAGLKLNHPKGASALEWVGFTSHGTAPAQWWLDDLVIENRAP